MRDGEIRQYNRIAFKRKTRYATPSDVSPPTKPPSTHRLTPLEHASRYGRINPGRLRMPYDLQLIGSGRSRAHADELNE